MHKIEIGNYVILTEEIEQIKKNSIGLVRVVNEDNVKVFFVGANKLVKVKSKYLEYLDITKTGKPYDKKICNICHVLKNMSEFDINQTDAKGRKTTRPSCKICRIDIDGFPLKASEKKRLDAIIPQDIFTCPICKKTSIVGVTANLVRDHDHITGNARAWICDSCNTGLGRFKDDIKLLEAVIEYLKSFANSQ
jgi:hypothetical protein